MFSPLARFLSLNQLLSIFPFIVMVTGEVAIRYVAGNCACVTNASAALNQPRPDRRARPGPLRKLTLPVIYYFPFERPYLYVSFSCKNLHECIFLERCVDPG